MKKHTSKGRPKRSTSKTFVSKAQKRSEERKNSSEVEILTWNEGELNVEESDLKIKKNKITVSVDLFDQFFQKANNEGEMKLSATNNKSESDEVKNKHDKVEMKCLEQKQHTQSSPLKNNEIRKSSVIVYQMPSPAATIPEVKPQKEETSRKVQSLDKKVFVISGKSGKPVTLKPKSQPILLNKDKVMFGDNNCLTTYSQSIPNFSSDNTKEKPVFKILKIDSANINVFKKDVPLSNVMSKKLINSVNFNKTNKCLNGVDKEIQTENSSKDISVQTEIDWEPMPSPSLITEDCPDISELVKFVLDTTKYSGELDEHQKSNLLDMSKNIASKEKYMAPMKNMIPRIDSRNTEMAQRDLKRRLFLDIRDCLCYDDVGNMQIHKAVLSNDLKAMMRQIYVLRIRGVSVDVPNSQGSTPLQLAITNDSDISIIQRLLEKGARVSVKDSEGNSLLHLAVLNSTENVLHLLLKCTQKSEIDNRNDEGLTPLMLAAINKKPEFVEQLLERGANPNLRDAKSGRTALFHAVESDCDYIIKLLLRYKADPKVNNFLGLCPIDAARDLQIPSGTLLEIVSVDKNKNLSESMEICKPIKKRGREQQKDGKCKITFITSLQKISSQKDIVDMPSGKRFRTADN